MVKKDKFVFSLVSFILIDKIFIKIKHHQTNILFHQNKRDSKSDFVDFGHWSSQEKLCISRIDSNQKQQKRKEKAESSKKQYNEISE